MDKACLHRRELQLKRCCFLEALDELACFVIEAKDELGVAAGGGEMLDDEGKTDFITRIECGLLQGLHDLEASVEAVLLDDLHLTLCETKTQGGGIQDELPGSPASILLEA